MQLAWFACLYLRWHLWKEGLLTQVRAFWPWRLGRRMLKHRLRQRWQRLQARWRPS